MDKVKQQVIETIKGHSNVLVTVSTNPSVDELSAALGLTIMLNNLDKRATCVFSGTIPPAINFLEPDKTFENSADSLRDFIIALDKEKADHLRYKVEGEAVKIFITPYKTQLSQSDLEFSQGDYNVELVIALGVTDQGHLDKALESHGKILHDATVLTVTVGAQGSDLGSIDWHNEKTSSLSEIIAGLADDLKGDQPLLDQQIASALLTGIVSATDRFSNDHTSSGAMTVAARLMAAGANQQLIAAKLEEAHNIAPSSPAKNDSESVNASESGAELSIERPEKGADQAEKGTPSPVAPSPPPSSTPTNNPQAELEKHLADMTGSSVGASGTMADIEKQLQSAASPPPPVTSVPQTPAPVPPPVAPSPPPVVPSPAPAPAVEPPSVPVVPPVAPQENQTSPRIIQRHDKMLPGEPPAINSAQSSSDEEAPINIFDDPGPSASLEKTESTIETTGASEGVKTPNVSDAPQTPQAVPSGVPTLPPLPPMPPNASSMPLPPPPPPPPMTGMADGSATPPMPSGPVSGDVFGDNSTATQQSTSAAPAEPGQFRIPGQA